MIHRQQLYSSFTYAKQRATLRNKESAVCQLIMNVPALDVKAQWTTYDAWCIGRNGMLNWPSVGGKHSGHEPQCSLVSYTVEAHEKRLCSRSANVKMEENFQKRQTITIGVMWEVNKCFLRWWLHLLFAKAVMEIHPPNTSSKIKYIPSCCHTCSIIVQFSN